MEISMKNNWNLKELAEIFLDVKAVEVSKSSYDNNKLCIENLLAICDEDATLEEGYEKLSALLAKYKPTSYNTFLARYKVFFNWCLNEGYTDLEFKIKKKKTEEKHKEPFTENEIKILLEKPNKQRCTFVEFRNWVICYFFLGTGCRSRTLRNIKIGDLDFNNYVVHFNITKTHKIQIIPLDKRLIKVLREYLRIRGGEEEDYLFVTSHAEKMERTYLIHTMTKYFKNRKITKTGLHRFRHTFAINYLRNGGDILRLQKILGHSSLQTTQIYLNWNVEDLKENFDSFSALSVVDKKDMIRINHNKRIC